MESDRTALLAPGDLAAATGLLTRLPVRVDGDAARARGAAAAWAYPLAGLIVAALAATLGSAAIWADLPTMLVAGLVMLTQIMVTGALHEDGLADTCDGLWGGWDRDRRLAIMSDSRIGAYGVIALVLGLGLRWQALAVLIAADLLWPGLIAVAMLSRAAMVGVMHALPHARPAGLSAGVGRPGRGTSLLAAAIALAGAALLGSWAILPVLLACLSALVVAAFARARIGGQTGDILGATQQVTEIAMLLGLTVLVSG